jgi:hypothetical protein
VENESREHIQPIKNRKILLKVGRRHKVIRDYGQTVGVLQFYYYAGELDRARLQHV